MLSSVPLRDQQQYRHWPWAGNGPAGGKGAGAGNGTDASNSAKANAGILAGDGTAAGDGTDAPAAKETHCEICNGSANGMSVTATGLCGVAV